MMSGDSEQTDQGKRQKATRIEEDSFTFNRVMPIVLGALAVITVLLVLASLAVMFGIF